MKNKFIKLLLVVVIIFTCDMSVYAAKKCYKCEAMETTQAGKKYIYYWDNVDNFDTIKSRQNCKKADNECCDGSKKCATTESTSGTCYKCNLDGGNVHYYWKEDLPSQHDNCTRVSSTSNCVNQKGDFYEKPDTGTNKVLNDSMAKVIKFIKQVVFNTIQIFVPILLIVFGSIDLGRAVVAGDDRAIKDSTSKFIRRCLTAVAVFFVVTIVNIVMGAIAKTGAEDTNSWKYYWTKS